MRDKYVEESFPRWHIQELVGTADVCVSSDRDDIVVPVSRMVAERLVFERNMIIDALVAAIGDDYSRLQAARVALEKSIKR